MAANMAAKTVNLSNFLRFLSILTGIFFMDNYKFYSDHQTSCKNIFHDICLQKFKMAANMAAITANLSNFQGFYRF